MHSTTFFNNISGSSYKYSILRMLSRSDRSIALAKLQVFLQDKQDGLSML